MIDVRQYRNAVRGWRRDYARLSQSIRQAKRDAAMTGAGQPARQRTLAILQNRARDYMFVRAQQKDFWALMNDPLRPSLIAA